MDTGRIASREIMTADPVTVGPAQHVLDALDLLLRRGVSGLPVVEDGRRAVGRFSEQSAIRALDLADAVTSGTTLKNRSVLSLLLATDIMQPPRVRLTPKMDVFEAAESLLHHRVSGAPIIDNNGRLQGVFSEQSALHVYVGLCWDQMPSASALSWADQDPARIIPESMTLPAVLERFRTTRRRRLMVIRDDRLIGEVSRRDALAAALECSRSPLTESRSRHGAGEMGLKTSVGSWMTSLSNAVHEHDDVLAVGRIFLRSAARQIAVLRTPVGVAPTDGSQRSSRNSSRAFTDEFIGLISRSDLLRAVQRHFPVSSTRYQNNGPLYLSSLRSERDITAAGQALPLNSKSGGIL